MLTASVFKRVLTGTAKGHASLLAEMRAAEPMSDNDYPATCWGKTYEAEARDMFALVTGHTVVPPPLFYIHDDPALTAFVGASPDGVVVMPDGVEIPIEIKCPYNQDVHDGYRSTFPVDEYGPQVYGQQWVMRSPSSFFVSYDPRHTNDDGVRVGELVVHRVQRDDDYIARLDRKTRSLVEHLKEGTTPTSLDVMTDKLPTTF